VWLDARLISIASMTLIAALALPPAATPVSLGAVDTGEALHAAVRLGDAKEVARLVNAGTPVDARDSLGSTPLLDAAWTGNLEIVRFLLAHGAQVNARHREAGVTPLQYAVLKGSAAVVEALLNAGAQVNVLYRDGQSPLHIAAARANTPVLELLLGAHASVTALDANDNTALDAAVLHNQPAAVMALLHSGADVRQVHRADGRGVLHEVSIKGYANLVDPVVEAGADPVLRDRSGQTPLDLALAYKNGKVVAALLRLGVKLAESQAAAEQAMESATMRGLTGIARLLIDSGFDINKPTASGSTYLHDAALKGQRKVAELLLDRGARLDARNQTGGTPLHDAALGGSTEVIELLLNRGAAINARDQESGATPLMLAASLGRAAAVALLLHRGADPLLRDHGGRRALERAQKGENAEIIKLLEVPVHGAPAGAGSA
jgi:ankyrin repeat protein